MATSLRALADEASVCTACPLHEHATQTVFGRGPARAAIMLVGEQPGDHEDRAGEPFVGPAGRLLRECLQEAGLDAGAVYLTNAVKHFKWEPRGKARIHKTPTAGEIRACHPWLERELAAVGPQVVVALGASAARSVLGRAVKIGEVRGRVLSVDGQPDTIVTTHPSAVLRVRDAADRDELRATLVADLRLAARTAGPSSSTAARTASPTVSP